uniref:Uncharacterized protein n=1 Tax=Candidatus Kentrum sp. DK TaxID=2126562 RepID=A0A450TGP5_9GAMM|nr:MAG: hypothetical protein BECKDK2373B_GA0170837_11672 [Candidatus Kentron sp. DK]
MLFSSTGVNNVALQYSVSDNWEDKISRTLRRLGEKFPDVQIVIYMTNQIIGAKGDEIRTKVLSKGFALDIRDRNVIVHSPPPPIKPKPREEGEEHPDLDGAFL